MLAIEDVLRELSGEDLNEQGLPPGFRFHPTDEELITFYLASKVYNSTFGGVQIAEVDLNRCEPWELPDVAKMGEREWYFFSLRDRKYPTGLRTNRATGAGYWKATGKDREVFSATNGALLGMKKTLVFYKGRAPRGEKTKWVMHEYRLDGEFSCRHTCKEEWVICRIYHKNGEKKNALFQGRQGCLPPLLEAPSSSALMEYPPYPPYSQTQNPNHNPFVIQHQENEVKRLINPVVSQSHLFPINGFQPNDPFSPTTNKNSNPSPSQSPFSTMLFKSLLSHQDCTSKEYPTIPKQCKTEPSFSHLQPLPPNHHHHHHHHLPLHHQSLMEPYHYHETPFLFETDYNGMLGFSAAASHADAATLHEMSTSIAFNSAMLDPLAKLAGESWPLDA
ncbi:hypothetical protein UlMin_033889 [Ulmus minor]